MSKLSEQDIEKQLLRLPDWEYFDNAIHAEFEFENFKDCFSAMSRIAFECEALNHHPNWSNVYNVLSISLSTHDAGGVTLNLLMLFKLLLNQKNKLFIFITFLTVKID